MELRHYDDVDLYLMCALFMFSCSRLPRYILLENVRGFESSAMRNELIRVLNSLDFQFQVTCMHMCCCVYISG